MLKRYLILRFRLHSDNQKIAVHSRGGDLPSATSMFIVDEGSTEAEVKFLAVHFALSTLSYEYEYETLE